MKIRLLALWTITAVVAIALPVFGQLLILVWLVAGSHQWAQGVEPLFLSLGIAELGAIFLVASLFKQWHEKLMEARQSISAALRLAGDSLGQGPCDSLDETQLPALVGDLCKRLAEASKAIGDVEEQLLEQRKSMRGLIDKAVDVICLINAQGQIVSINDACETAWGYKPAALLGKPLNSLLEAGKADQVMPLALGAMYSINKIVFESRLRKQDGQLLDVILTGHWSASESGFFCIIHDVSEQRAFERLKSEFVSMVAHDIRTPLASMLIFLELAEKGLLGNISEKGAKHVAMTRTKCKRLLRLLNDMLQLDKMEAGSFELQLANVDMVAVVHDCIETVKPSAQVKWLTIEEVGRTASCWGDELRLTQVVLNLLTNAVKYAPERSKIAVGIEDRHDSVVVTVSDQGNGIPQDKLEKIFERFEQVAVDDARQRHGIGLGLAICKAIVNQHGGKIGVDSTIGLGSNFWFSIPKAPLDVHQQPQAMPS